MKRVTFFILVLFSSSFLCAQYFYYDDQYYDNDILWEGGISAGFMNVAADVGEKFGSYLSPKNYDWKSVKTNVGIYFGVSYKSFVGARLEFSKGMVAGKDANSNSSHVRARNLSFRSHIYEGSLIGMLYPLELLNQETLPPVSPYLMAGIGIFSFYPRTKYKGEWVGLRPLHTEGQNSKLYPERKEYSLTSLCFPIGFGLKYEYSAKWNIRLEGLFRYTTTDYIDDVSTTYADPASFKGNVSKAVLKEAILLAHRYKQLAPARDLTGRSRGNPENNDKYVSLNLKVGFVIGRTRIPINDVP